MSFSIDMLRSRLESSTEAVDSVTSTAQWILFHKRHASAIAQEWASVLKAGDNKLCLIYIANEVIQQNKMKRKSEFLDAFAPVLPDALLSAYSSSNLATRDRIVRVVKVWRERSMFSESAQEAIEQALTKKTTDGIDVPDALIPLVKLYTRFSQNPQNLVTQLKEEIRKFELKVDQMAEAGAVELNHKEVTPVVSDQEGELYTAKDAVTSKNDKSLDDEAVGYAESGDEEPQPKKQKLEVDPKLASFLASLS